MPPTMRQLGMRCKDRRSQLKHFSCKRFAIALTSGPADATYDPKHSPPGVLHDPPAPPRPCRRSPRRRGPAHTRRMTSSRSSPPSPSSPTWRATSPATPPMVESITRPGAEIHEYQPTPRDIVARAGCRSDPVERAQSRTLVRALLRQSARCAERRRDRWHRADGHRRGPL